MVLLVLRLLAVYFGSAALALWLANRFVSRLRPRAALFLALCPFVFVGKAMLTAGAHAPIDIAYQAPPLSAHAAESGIRGTQTPILTDVVNFIIPSRAAVREAIRHGQPPLWNRFLLAGAPLLASQQPAALHPATWIGLLLPLAQAWTFEMALRYLLALLCMYLFLRELECGDVAALTGAAAWAFSDYLVFYLGYPLNAATAPFPLLLLALSRLARAADRASVGLAVFSVLLIVASGHPETLLHCAAGGAIFFVGELAAAPRGRRWRALKMSFAAAALAAGLGAVLLLPFLEVVPFTAEHSFRRDIYAHQRRSAPPAESVQRAIRNAVPFYYGVSGRSDVRDDFHEPASYAGSVVWPFAVVGLFSRRREKRVLLLLALLGIAVGARMPGLADGLSRLPLFNIGINDRMVFLTAFGIAALAGLGLERLSEGAGGRTLALASAAALALIAALFVPARAESASLKMAGEYFEERVLFQVVPLVLAALVWLILLRKAPKVALASTLLLLLVQRRLEEGPFYPTFPSRAFYPRVASLDAIPRGAPERVAGVGFTLVPNIGALYGLEDARGYEAMTFRPLVETFPLWCVAQPVWFNRVDDPTRPFLSFLNVKYFFGPPGYSPPPGWPVLYRGDEGVVFENPSALPRAFVPRVLAREPDAGRQLALLGAITDFGQHGVAGESPLPGAAAYPWQLNGRASVRIASYGLERMTMEIDASEPALVATSLTAWPGWKLAVDGATSPLISYNHAFLSFHVSAGRHTAILRYLPDGFLRGSAATAATLLLCVLLSLRGRPARTVI